MPHLEFERNYLQQSEIFLMDADLHLLMLPFLLPVRAKGHLTFLKLNILMTKPIFLKVDNSIWKPLPQLFGLVDFR